MNTLINLLKLVPWFPIYIIFSPFMLVAYIYLLLASSIANIKNRKYNKYDIQAADYILSKHTDYKNELYMAFRAYWNVQNAKKANEVLRSRLTLQNIAKRLSDGDKGDSDD